MKPTTLGLLDGCSIYRATPSFNDIFFAVFPSTSHKLLLAEVVTASIFSYSLRKYGFTPLRIRFSLFLFVSKPTQIQNAKCFVYQISLMPRGCDAINPHQPGCSTDALQVAP